MSEIIYYGGDLQLSSLSSYDENFSQYLLDNMKKNAENVAQIDADTDKVQTHGEIRLFSIRCALKMKHEYNVGRGDIITIFSRTHLNLVIPFLATTYLGATVSGLHPDYSPSELKRLIDLTTPKIIFCDQESQIILKSIMNELKFNTTIITFETDFDLFIQENNCYKDKEETFKAESVNAEDDNAFIICTSGTTGFIKGVTVNYKSALIYMHRSKDFIPKNYKTLLYSPISWVSAVWTYILIFFNGAIKIVVDYDPIRNLEVISKYKVQWLLLTPTQISEMLSLPEFDNYPDIIENVQKFVFGGYLSSIEQTKKCHQIFKNAFVANMYGSTEMFSTHAAINPIEDREMHLKKLNSHGHIPPGIYWKIVDKKTGKSVGPGTEGELLIKGPTLTKGYYKDPIATSEVIDKDGWYHTGDIVVLDDDLWIYVVGRYKELFKYKGWKISPCALEEIIQQHKAVQHVCVMGKPHPQFGDLPLAFIQLKAHSTSITPHEIINFVNNQVVDSHKLRGGVIFLDEMPLTPTGKIRKMLLKKLIPTD